MIKGRGAGGRGWTVGGGGRDEGEGGRILFGEDNLVVPRQGRKILKVGGMNV